MTTHRNNLDRIWREAEAEVSVPHLGNCAKCGGSGTFFPYLQLADGSSASMPTDSALKTKLFAAGAMIRARFVCPCCSRCGCTCRTSRERQMDRALEVINSGGDKKSACEAANLSPSRESKKLIAFWAMKRRLETPAEYVARCMPSKAVTA